jgi:DNA-binding NarL/FixJ family response regulator
MEIVESAERGSPGPRPQYQGTPAHHLAAAPDHRQHVPMNPALRACVAVASDQPLVADVIAAALSDSGFQTSVLHWPGVDCPADEDPSLRHGRMPDVALMVSDFDRPARIRSAVQLILEVPGSWVVLTGAPRGPLWGALLDMGSVHVAPATLGLEEVSELLVAVAHGHGSTSEPERAELVGAWWSVLDEHEQVIARLATMTPRETEVLKLLYAGSPVRTIAEQLDVAEATVRTQVKRVLRKLDVRSQLAAVAAFEHLHRVQSVNGSDLAATMWLGRHHLLTRVGS